MKNIVRVFLVVLAMAVSVFCSAQSDKGIKEKNVPVAVKDYINKNYPDASKLKYNKETEGDSSFYKAMFRFKNDQYNILLYEDGRIYETEIVKNFEELPISVKENISKDLNARYSKYSVQLVEQVNPAGGFKYEINVRATKGNHQGYFEIFYDRNGSFLEEEEKIIKSIPSNSGF